MSKSKRKTPISAVTGCDGNKQFKQQEHRRERRTVRMQLQAGREDWELPHTKKYGNEWDSPRDGKMWFGDMKYGSPAYYWLWRYTKETIEEHIEDQKREYERLMRK